jgi:signal transduction histidine kinase
MSTPGVPHLPVQDRRLTTLERLLGIGAANLEGALDEASDLLAATLGADKVDVFLYDPSRASLIARGTSHTPMGAKQHAIGMEQLPLANGGRTVEVFETGRSWITGRADEDPSELRGITQGLGVRSILLAPLTVVQERQGVLSVVSAKPDLWSAEDLRFVEAAGSWVGLVVQQTVLVERLAVHAREQARRAAADELIAVVAHDFRNYLAPIRGRVQLLRRWAEAQGDVVATKDIGELSTVVDRLAAVVADLLDSARLDQGLLTLELGPVDLVPFAAEIARTMSTPGQSVRVVSAHATVCVNADPARLHQGVQNLISNALKFSPKGVPVTLEIAEEQRAQGRWGLLHVMDEGPGVPPELQARMFDRFARGPGSPGLGLGLYLARRIAEAHDGALTVESRPGGGSRFTLALPLLE